MGAKGQNGASEDGNQCFQEVLGFFHGYDNNYGNYCASYPAVGSLLLV